MEPNTVSPREIKRILNEFCLRPHKKWGQNFLIDSNIVKKILKEVDLSKEDRIVEIGPGLGALTLPLANHSAFVIAIEIDHGLVRFLNGLLASYDNKLVIESDIRKVDIPGLLKSVFGSGEFPVKYVANLPYYITSPFIYSLIKDCHWEKAVLMVQKEVALRIQASAGSPLYGTLSVLCRHYTNSRLAFTVSPHVFFPTPRVESAVVVLEPGIERPEVGDESLFVRLVSGIFRHRRKTVLNSLAYNFKYDRLFIAELLRKAEVDPQRRPDSLSHAEFANICRLIYNNISDKN